jgi:hypothetical protein
MRQSAPWRNIIMLDETSARLLRGTIIALKICEKCSFTLCKLSFLANFCLILVPLMTPCKGLWIFSSQAVDPLRIKRALYNSPAVSVAGNAHDAGSGL